MRHGRAGFVDLRRRRSGGGPGNRTWRMSRACPAGWRRFPGRCAPGVTRGSGRPGRSLHFIAMVQMEEAPKPSCWAERRRRAGQRSWRLATSLDEEHGIPARFHLYFVASSNRHQDTCWRGGVCLRGNLIVSSSGQLGPLYGYLGCCRGDVANSTPREGERGSGHRDRGPPIQCAAAPGAGTQTATLIQTLAGKLSAAAAPGRPQRPRMGPGPQGDRTRRCRDRAGAHHHGAPAGDPRTSSAQNHVATIEPEPPRLRSPTTRPRRPGAQPTAVQATYQPQYQPGDRRRGRSRRRLRTGSSAAASARRSTQPARASGSATTSSTASSTASEPQRCSAGGD